MHTLNHITCFSAVVGFVFSSKVALFVSKLRRDMSCLLVFTLLLLSAITFSTENIPNFTPDCETSQVNEVKKQVAAEISIIPIKRTASAPFAIKEYFLAVVQTSKNRICFFPPPSRAPPIVTVSV
ncbi:MAG: hypothetical protein PHN84_11705 [Desulfuromonadaceae bacterium]|nr:hypothetical protein [Desulfuromonadaceae bacterium]MDD2855709.1 hypothetical protein [Desulfuromonadaceae bacterium]